MDDIQDSSELRRGDPTAHLIYGAGRTIAGADFSRYSYFLNRMSNQSTEVTLVDFNLITLSFFSFYDIAII